MSIPKEPTALINEAKFVIDKVKFGFAITPRELEILLRTEHMLIRLKPTNGLRSAIGIDRLKYVMAYVHDKGLCVKVHGGAQ